MGQVQIPLGRVIRLLAKTIRMSKGGLDKDERRDLGLELLLIAAHVLEGLDDTDNQERLFNRAMAATDDR